jgi:xanthine dehydrogenase accessory factor
MSARRLIESFARWRASAEPLALATVFETAGSTYSKAGHRILIAASGDYRGLVSGGCLEGDLAERAREAIASGRSRAVTYDLRDEADELWGLGIGCNGLLRVFLQPLTPESGYEPFATIAECLSGTRAGAVATLIDAPEELGTGGTVGWSVTVADHRPGYVARPGFERATRVVLIEPGKLAAALALAEFDAIVVMSHHLATDRKYLAELANVRSAYLGVLGPRARRDRLLRELAEVAPALAGRLRGPVGLDIGADSPETIALSILAELQATLGAR